MAPRKRQRTKSNVIVIESLGKIGKETYHRIIKSEDEIYAIGDCVALQEDEVRLATIMSLWNSKGNETMAEIRYYLKMNELPESLYKKIYNNMISEEDEDIINMKMEKTLFETDDINEIQVMNFKYKFNVFDEMNPNLKENDYVCTQFYAVYGRILRSIDTRLSRYQRSQYIYSKRMIAWNEMNKKSELSDMLENDQSNKSLDQGDNMVSSTAAIEKIQEACKKLLLSNIPDSLPGREKEYKLIYRKLFNGVKSYGLSSPLYISGLPGIGKTATVKQVLHELEIQSHQGLLPKFEWIEINGMKMSKPELAYNILWQTIQKHHLEHRQISSMKASELVGKELRTNNPSRPIIIVLLDEMDFMVNKKSLVLYNLFDWPTHPNAKLIIVGIANTMDLPERLPPKIRSRMGVERISFAPYTSSQIQNIVRMRLLSLDVFDRNTIEIFAKRIGNQSGDIRKALMLCKHAAELCLRRLMKENTGIDTANDKVNLQDMHLARKASSQSATYLRIEHSRTFECLVLISIALEMKHAMKEEIEFEQIVERVQTICQTTGHSTMHTLGRDDIYEICLELATSRILVFEKEDIYRYPNIRLTLSYEEMQVAMQYHPVGRNILS